MVQIEIGGIGGIWWQESTGAWGCRASRRRWSGRRGGGRPGARRPQGGSSTWGPCGEGTAGGFGDGRENGEGRFELMRDSAHGEVSGEYWWVDYYLRGGRC